MKKSQRGERGLTICSAALTRWRTVVVPPLQWLDSPSFGRKHREVSTTQSHISAYICVCLCVCGYCYCAFDRWFLKRIKRDKKSLCIYNKSDNLLTVGLHLLVDYTQCVNAALESQRTQDKLSKISQ